MGGTHATDPIRGVERAFVPPRCRHRAAVGLAGTTDSSVLWRRVDQAGHDCARLSESVIGLVIHGTSVFAESGRPCRLDYRVMCDLEWRTVAARVTGWIGTSEIKLKISVNAAREWMLNGQACPDLDGCHDLDLSFTPATNLLPIRREHLAVGARAAVRAAWLRFPELTLEPLDQVYERIAESSYRYGSNNGTFVTQLETNPCGFVVDYPGLWTIQR